MISIHSKGYLHIFLTTFYIYISRLSRLRYFYLIQLGKSRSSDQHSASCLVGNSLKCLTKEQVIWLRHFAVFLKPFRQNFAKEHYIRTRQLSGIFCLTTTSLHYLNWHHLSTATTLKKDVNEYVSILLPIFKSHKRFFFQFSPLKFWAYSAFLLYVLEGHSSHSSRFIHPNILNIRRKVYGVRYNAMLPTSFSCWPVFQNISTYKCSQM